VVGLGIEFTTAQFKGEENSRRIFSDRYVDSPGRTHQYTSVDGSPGNGFCRDLCQRDIWGTGYNIFNVALMARAFLFFAYPSKMSAIRMG
jgi:Na+-transporting NADH:ubiquinone oxidoreductase subunit B